MLLKMTSHNQCAKSIACYFAMFGALHIEQCLLRVHSQLIENNNSNKIFEICSLAATGVEAVVDINYIKRARYCSKVTLWVLH